MHDEIISLKLVLDYKAQHGTLLSQGSNELYVNSNRNWSLVELQQLTATTRLLLKQWNQPKPETESELNQTEQEQGTMEQWTVKHKGKGPTAYCGIAGAVVVT